MATKRFHFRVPYTTIYVAILVSLLTYLYNAVPQTWQTPLLLWLTSPFNITYEMNLYLNYTLLVLIFLLVELYTRNIAHLKGRISLIRNAGLLSVLSSYIVSALVWWYGGYPSSGTSILAFNMLIFSAFETYDAELIKRMSKRGEGFRQKLEIASLSFVFLVVILSAILFIYLNGNEFWYVHILGGIIFALLYYAYLNRWVRPRIDSFEETVEKNVERDLEKTGEELEEEAEKLERLGKRSKKKKETGRA